MFAFLVTLLVGEGGGTYLAEVRSLWGDEGARRRPPGNTAKVSRCFSKFHTDPLPYISDP